MKEIIIIIKKKICRGSLKKQWPSGAKEEKNKRDLNLKKNPPVKTIFVMERVGHHSYNPYLGAR